MIRACYFLSVLIYLVAGNSCKKGANLTTGETFIKLFPSDTSYWAGGAFQLADESFLLYGFTPEDNRLSPLLIKTDVKGNIKGIIRLPGDFHYCTIKPTGTGMIAVGVERDLSSSIHICEMDFEGNILSLNEYPIPYDIKSGPLIPPKFIMNAKDFIIAGTISTNKDLWPFILPINAGSAAPVKIFPYLAGSKVMNRGISGDMNAFTITGSTITGKLADIIKIESFCLRLNSYYDTLLLCISSDPDSSFSTKGLLANSASSTVLYGSRAVISNFPNSGFSDMVGTLYSQQIDMSGKVQEKVYTNYENLAHAAEMSETKDGGFIMAATTNELQDIHVGSDYQIYLLKLNKNLEEEWHRKFNRLNSFTVVSVCETSDGGYLISAYEHTSPLLYTMCLIKTDREGNIVSQ